MRAVLWLLLPIVAFFNIASLELTAEVGAGIGFGYAALAVALAAAYATGRLMQLPRPSVGALMLAAGFGNTGYLGLPFAAALFGLDALPDAVAYDTLVSGIGLVTIAFSVGAAFGTVATRPRERVRAFLVRNPPLWATLAGFLAPAALAPDWAVAASQAIVFLILPLGFFAVGVTLAATAERERLPFPPPLGRPVAAALAIKLLLTPAVVLGLSAALLRVPDPYLVQPAMATAINTLVVANEYGLDRALCAEAIAWSSVVVVAAGLALALL
jgi:predicted permease